MYLFNAIFSSGLSFEAVRRVSVLRRARTVYLLGRLLRPNPPVGHPVSESDGLSLECFLSSRTRTTVHQIFTSNFGMSQKSRKNGITLDLCHSRLLGAHQCMVCGAASSASAHMACVAVSGADGRMACVAVSAPPPWDSHGGARHRWGRYRVPGR